MDILVAVGASLMALVVVLAGLVVGFIIGRRDGRQAERETARMLYLQRIGANPYGEVQPHKQERTT